MPAGVSFGTFTVIQNGWLRPEARVSGVRYRGSGSGHRPAFPYASVGCFTSTYSTLRMVKADAGSEPFSAWKSETLTATCRSSRSGRTTTWKDSHSFRAEQTLTAPALPPGAGMSCMIL